MRCAAAAEVKKKKERQKRLKEAGDHDEDLSVMYRLRTAFNLCHMIGLSEVFCVRSLNSCFWIVSCLLLFEL